MDARVGKGDEILVVEDDRLLRCLAVEILQDEGYAAVGFEGAAEALSHLRTPPYAAMLVTDVNMPGMDGLELAWLAITRIPALKVLLISGRQLIDAGQLPPSAEFLQKPFSAQVFLAHVRRLMAA